MRGTKSSADFVRNNDTYWIAKVCKHFPGTKPSDFIKDLDDESKLKIDIAMAYKLENEEIEQYQFLLETILKAGGFEIKKKNKFTIQEDNNSKEKELPYLTNILPLLMGKGGVVIE